MFGNNKKLQTETNELADQLLNRKMKSYNSKAIVAFDLFRNMVNSKQSDGVWATPEELKDKIKKVGENLIAKDKLNFVVRNCVYRMLKMVRDTADRPDFFSAKMHEEDMLSLGDKGLKLVSLKQLNEKRLNEAQNSLMDRLMSVGGKQSGNTSGKQASFGQNGAFDELFDTSVTPRFDRSKSTIFSLKKTQSTGDGIGLSARKSSMMAKPKKATDHFIRGGFDSRGKFQETLLDQIEEIKEEINVSRESITEKAVEHINDGDLILTYSYSETLCAFLIEAKEKQMRFEVIVCETAPDFDGHKTALELAKAGIQTNLVQDAAVFGILSRCDKVIFSPHGIMATGGVITKIGGLLIAHAA